MRAMVTTATALLLSAEREEQQRAMLLRAHKREEHYVMRESSEHIHVATSKSRARYREKRESAHYQKSAASVTMT